MRFIRNLAAFVAFAADEFLWEVRKVQQHHRS